MNNDNYPEKVAIASLIAHQVGREFGWERDANDNFVVNGQSAHRIVARVMDLYGERLIDQFEKMLNE